MTKQRGLYEREKDSGEWWIRWTDQDGRLHREKAGTKSAALTLYRKRKQQSLERRKLPELHRRVVSFGEIAQDALTWSRQHKKAWRDDRYRMPRLLAWWKNRPADSLTPSEIEQRLSSVPGWSDASFNRTRALLSLTYKLAIRQGKVAQNPARLAPARRERNVRQGFVDDDQYHRLAQHCHDLDDLPMRTLLALGYTFGWRRGELLFLRVRHINLAERTARLECGTTKNDDGRTIQLTTECYELLKACIAGKPSDAPVFTREDGSPVKDFSKTWADLCVRAGLGRFICRTCETVGRPCLVCAKAKRKTTYAYQGLIFHDLRRSAVRNLERTGVPRSVAMKITGHRGESVYRRYAIVSPADLAEAVSRLERNRQLAPELTPVTSAQTDASAKLN